MTMIASDIPRRDDGTIDFDFRPTTEAQLEECLCDAKWRICSGYLYRIIIKGDDEEEGGLEAEFRPNEAQMDFLENLWYRNIVLKVRQRGFTTLICIMWLDHALFNPNSRCGVIAHDRESAEVIFRDKVKFAYDKLPDEIRSGFPLTTANAKELLFAHNNSSVRVGTSMRSGTIHRLLISEYGKICRKYPDKAREIQTGSLPAVPANGIVVIESTAEGADGDFHAKCQKAKKIVEAGRKPNKAEFKFNFADWMSATEYRMKPDGVIITEKDHQYFDKIEANLGITISLEQRAWWVSKRDNDFSSEDEKMWQEYPSTADEAFKRSTEGCYYTIQITRLRKSQRICDVPYTPGTPVNTFWDIGSGDGTAIWLHQRVGLQDRFIRFIEGWGESYEYFVKQLQALGYVWGAHYLPHDAGHFRQGMNNNLSPKQMIEKLGLQRIEIVQRIPELQQGINKTREVLMGDVWFDQTNCKAGIDHLEQYKKRWIESTGMWSDEPLKDIHTEGADSFRQFSQVIDKLNSPQNRASTLTGGSGVGAY